MTNTEPDSLEGLLLRSAATLGLELTPQMLASPDSVDYLSHLMSLTQSQLIQEPKELQSTSTNLDSDLSLLCFREFRTFLVAHDASVSIHSAFSDLDASLGRLLEDTSQLHSLVQGFSTTTEPILSDRNQMTVVLEHLGSIEDLLELPQLVSTCINAKLWNEAIELCLKLRELDLKMSARNHLSNSPAADRQNPSCGVLKRICSEVDRMLRSLRDNLLDSLKDPGLKLPLAVRTIGVLRRISTIFPQASSAGPFSNALSEAELRMAFLSSRWECLTDHLRQLELSSGFYSGTNAASSTTASISQVDLLSESTQSLNEDRTKFLRRWIEMWREFMGDTVSIYLEIFLTPPSASTPRVLGCPTPATHKYSFPPHFLDDPQILFIFFINQAISLLCSTLRHHLSLTVSVSHLASLLTQLAYCGSAFGKWGIDFTHRVAPLVVDRMEQVVTLRMKAGLQQLQTDLKPALASTPASSPFARTGFEIRRRSLHLPQTQAGGLETLLTSPEAIKQVLKLNLEDLGQADHTKLHSNWLSLFPPIAKFVNSQFSALNELRLLPAKVSYRSLSGAQSEIFAAATQEIQKTVMSRFESLNDHKVFRLKAAPNHQEATEGEDADKSASAFKDQMSIARCLLLMWGRNVLPVLENSLRVGVYSNLDVKEPDSRFQSVVADLESLLSKFLKPQQSANIVAGSLQPVAALDQVPAETEAPVSGQGGDSD